MKGMSHYLMCNLYQGFVQHLILHESDFPGRESSLELELP